MSDFDHSATYSPQDDKIRLYLGFRIPKDEWNRLKSAGFSWTMKQVSDLVGMWSPEREDIALELCGEIGDEDQPREERAADRAERFEGYGDKREAEAVGHADAYSAGPSVHGHQNEARATRAARVHDRLAGKAVSQWNKAEYWQTRTAGVIRHALHLEKPGVRHRRIKGIEADIRKLEKSYAEAVKIYTLWTKVTSMDDTEETTRYATAVSNLSYFSQDYQHPTNPTRRPTSLWSLLQQDQPENERITGKQAAALWLAVHDDPSTQRRRNLEHLQMRLAYEQQMLEAQGGTAANEVEIEAGGFYGTKQVVKVTKDRAGRVSKLYFLGPHPYRQDSTELVEHGISAERLRPGEYRAPTVEERAAFQAARKEGKAGKPKLAAIINPTMESAQRLQDQWNASMAACAAKNRLPPREGAAILVITQEEYSARSQGDYAPYRIINLADDGRENDRHHTAGATTVCRIRLACGNDFYRASRVIVLSDKPQQDLPLAAPTPAPTPSEVSA